MKIRLIVAILIALLTIPAQAQRRKSKRITISPEEQKRLEKIERMKAATEKVMIIDSIVVDKNHFINHYNLSPETGSIKDGDDFFHVPQNDGFFVYLNEIGNKCYFSKAETDSTSNLYYTEAANMEWSEPSPLAGINDEQQFKRVNYPYMMGDGSTFYFAATGDEEGLGGYDIYMTTYDEEENRFLRPVNIGMPFNSEANDYLYVIDEYRQLGYFVTDRRQPEGKVCIYIFVPAESRQTYDAGVYSEQQIRDFAAITRIADTWTDNKAREAAMARLKAVNSAQKRVKTVAPDAQQCLVITDALTYSTASDFKSKEAASLYQQLVQVRQKLSQLESQTEQLRTLYHQAGKAERKSLQTEIMEAEGELKALYTTEKRLEKQTRQAEIKVIN
jgi:hypothetical protein